MSNSQARQHQTRKSEHLSLCLKAAVDSDSARTGFDGYQFVHEALPEINLDKIDLRSRLFDYELSAPFILSPMTGGCPEAKEINHVLAEAAQMLGLAIGVGSQRVALLDKGLARTFQVRDIAPDAFIFANLGAIQLNNGFTIDECKVAIDMISANALYLHLNPLQESVQAEGNTNFIGLIDKIEEVCSKLDLPVVVKEVGQGISERTASMLRDAGVAGIDTAGAGGTSWARVESFRQHNGRAELGNTFADWGIPTADSIRMCRKAVPDILLIGSGGLRSGIDAAKAIALGADIAGFGLPLLREAVKGIDAVVHRLNQYREELRIAMFCIGANNINELKWTKALRSIHRGNSE
jgi:isopentenyl-diphosphate delta-isomerase